MPPFLLTPGAIPWRVTTWRSPQTVTFARPSARALPSFFMQHRTSSLLRAGVAVTAMLAAGIATPLAAQTDYYNTDAGRPIRIEDAYPIERRAFELQAAPLRLERNRGGQYRWGIEPEFAYGIFPRTQVEVGVPLAWIDAGLGARTTGVAGIDIGILHNLNVETRLPALAIAADVLLPVGNLGPDKAYPSLKGIATKTFSWARFHVNGQYTFGEADETPGAAPAIGAQAVEVSRWLAGVAVDRPFPLRSVLLTGELYAERGLHDADETEWNAGLGTRYQLSPRWAVDAGLGRRLTGADQTWSLTAGGAFAFGLPWSR